MTHDDLVAKYPKILSGSGYPGVGEGWLPLIDQLCSWLQFNTDMNEHPQVKAVQIKEKFGGLRFYVETATEKQYAVISFVENMSQHICDVCGSPGKIQGKGWISTRCEEHKDK